MNSISNPAVEQIAGIDTYLSKTPGIGGRIRSNPGDFRVTEVWDVGQQTSGQYLIVRLTKENWDAHHLIRELSRRFRVSNSRFGWAGTKDKRAVTTQRIGIWDPDHTIEAMVPDVRISGVELEIIGRSNKKVSLGDLMGNDFRIVVRDIDGVEREVRERIESISSELSHAGGCPNFYGMQRFGTIRPITHEVGRFIVAGDFEGAVMVYLAKTFPGDGGEEGAGDRSSEIRRSLQETHDFKEALNRFPEHLRYERAMLNHLVKHPNDHIGALGVLQKNLLRMFVHAHQSAIFNKILSTRIKENIPLNCAAEGDTVCFRDKSGLPDTSKTEVVTQANIDGINNLVRRRRAWVAHSLIGYESELTSELEVKVVSDLGIDVSELVRGSMVPEIPELASKGGYRAVVVNTDPVFEVAAVGGGGVSGGGEVSATAGFFLPKGCYATVLLREYVKN
jgi:tRNA pseudouridine13 synthase